MSGPFYTRWVPPSKAASTTKILPPAHSPVSKPYPAPASLEAVPQKKKKSKRKSIEQPLEPIETPNDDISYVDADVSQQAPDSIKKPKKRKRELKVDGQAEEEEATPKKHKAILSKFDKVKKAEAARGPAEQAGEGNDEAEKAGEELHDLVPLPKPAQVPDAPFAPTFSALPPWLANPVSVESSKKVPFSQLGVHPTFLRKLEKQGFTDAMAVQSVLLPMLHTGFEQHLGDTCVSARTGSGKTLAYLLPIIEALKDQPVTALSAIVVVPTRQLVDQALKVAEDLCAGTKLKVGTAVGNVPFATEQKQLVKLRAQYDPERAKELHEKASQQLSTAIAGRGGIFNDLATMPKNHVPQYDSGVDILICTPGRLVEHIESTTGFLLRSVRWLVIDEADQLLTQNFQGWASLLIDALHSETPEDFMNSQERLRQQRRSSTWSMALPARRHITKVVLSATMKKDLTKLGTLRLNRPKLVVVEDEVNEQPVATDGDVFELPTTLAEYAIPVRDGSNKPLYLLYTLLRHIFKTTPMVEAKDDSDTDSSESDSDSSDEESQPKGAPDSSIENHHNRVLIFAKSNENASRLSHLLSVLEPSLKPFIKTMTPSATAKQSQKLLRSFGAGKIKILIASDAASRGLDIPDITHVINYDIPSSITSYVHRVGRTARAGKEGQAMTLVTKTEAGWFWNQVAKGGNVKRGGKKVTRVELKERDVTWDRKRTYQEALKELQGAVEGGGEGAGAA